MSIDSRDQFLWKEARDEASATLNTGTSVSSGFHWVSVVYYIKKEREDHGTQPGTGEVHTPAASSQRRLNLNFTGSAPSSSLLFRREDEQPEPTAPVDTHPVGSFLSQVILVLYAVIAVIGSQNPTQAQRQRADYKNRFLVR